MKQLKFVLVFLSCNVFSQENFLEKSCDTLRLGNCKSIEFENSDFKTGLINEGAFFISSFSELKSFLKTKKKNTYIENIGNQIINIDFDKNNLILFTGFFAGIPGTPPSHKFKCYAYNNKYTFQLTIYYNNPVNAANVPIYHYFIIPKNISKEDINFYQCEHYKIQ